MISADPLYQQIILKAFLDIKLESPLGESVHLYNELMRSVFLSLASVIGLYKVNLQRFVLDYYYVLNEPIEFNYEVHHVLGVLLVRLDFVKLVKVISISFKRKDFQQSILSFVHYLINSHYLGLLILLVLLMVLYFLNNGFLDCCKHLCSD